MLRLSLILGVLVCGLPALAQTPHFSFGAMGGARLSRGAPGGSYHDESRLYTVGPALEVSFGEHIAVELNALYRRFGYSNVFPLTAGPLLRGHGVRVPTFVGHQYYRSRLDDRLQHLVDRD